MEENKQSQQPWIAVIRPSRGLVFAEVEEYFEQIRDNYPNIRIFRTHNLPLYDCFNIPVEEALQNKKYEYFWFSEDDTVPPAFALDEMLKLLKTFDVAAIQYPFNGGWGTIGKSAGSDKILFTGLGCTLVKRKVLESLVKPIFKVDKSFNISSLQWYSNPDPSKIYGQADIRFGSELREKGFTIGQVPNMICRHLQLIALGQPETNHGVHQIGEKAAFEKELLLPIDNL